MCAVKNPRKSVATVRYEKEADIKNKPLKALHAKAKQLRKSNKRIAHPTKPKIAWQETLPEQTAENKALLKVRDQLIKYEIHLKQQPNKPQDTILKNKLSTLDSLINTLHQAIKGKVPAATFFNAWNDSKAVLETHRPKSLGRFKLDFMSRFNFSGKEVVSNINKLIDPLQKEQANQTPRKTK